MRYLFPLILFSISTYAQSIGLGFKAGVPLNDALEVTRVADPAFYRDRQQYTIGASAEVRLPFSLAVEGDVLYSRLNLERSGDGSHSWEIPILIKYKLSGVGPIRPFIGAGPTFRHLNDILAAARHEDNGGRGLVIGGGLELKLLLLRITPELRYSRWGEQTFEGINGPIIRGKQNQTQFLVGFSF